MFKERTVFILGAGASVHYGYPTGAELLRLVAKSADELFRLTDRRFQHSRDQALAFELARDKTTREQHDPLRHERTSQSARRLVSAIRDLNIPVIDHLLAKVAAVQDIGRLCIADALLKKREQTREERDTHGESFIDHHDWVRYLIHPLTSGCTLPDDILKDSINPVYFVTFNYDRSLERRLTRALRSIDGLSDDELIQRFLQERIVHVYGTINDTDECAQLEENERWNRAFSTSSDLLVIGGDPKLLHVERVARAKAWILSASRIFILGFGFDEDNCKLVGMDQLNPTSLGGHRRVGLTNYGDVPRINEIAGQLFGLSDQLRSFSNVVVPGLSVQKSVKNVYRALSEDFVLPM